MSARRWIIAGSVLASLLVVVVIVVVVVSGGGEEPTATAPSGAPEGFGAASEELQQCLAEQGIEPGATPDQGAPDADAQAAFEACQQYLPEPPGEGEFPGGAPPEGLTPPSS